MSEFSGKCDFADHIGIGSVDRVLNHSDVFIGNNIIPLKFESEKDLIPYYPYIIGMMGSSDGYTSIRLSSRSYVDVHEDEIRKCILGSVLKKYRKLKRNKEEITAEKLTQSFYNYVYQMDIDIAQIVLEKGEKTSLDDLKDIHSEMCEYYRKKLYEEMVKAGWNKNKALLWCFGWRKKYPDSLELT